MQVLILILSIALPLIDANKWKEIDPLLTADLFEGDISGVTKKNLHSVTNGENLWTDGKVPYKIDSNLDHNHNRAISKAITRIQRSTCVEFIPVSINHSDYISFVHGKGCSSYIGKRGGEQKIVVGIGCDTVGVVLHLLMHALGFWHENSRTDRDEYLLINWDNVREDKTANFEAYTLPKSKHLGETFDYQSVMFMSPYAYGKDEIIPTILSKDERYQLGQRLQLSSADVNKIVKCYCGRRSGIPDPEPEPGENEVEGIPNIPSNPQEIMAEIRSTKCADRAHKCPLWATQGQCYKRADFMDEYCQESCMKCKTDSVCTNYKSLCGVWAWLGKCTHGAGSSAREILNICPLACGVCLPPEAAMPPANSGSCADYHQNCENWAGKGMCFYQHIMNLCPKSCDQCDLTLSTLAPMRRLRAPVSTCVDRKSNCSFLSKFCGRIWVRKNCAASCGLCENDAQAVDTVAECKDLNKLCHLIPSDYVCTGKLLKRRCPRTCGICL